MRQRKKGRQSGPIPEVVPAVGTWGSLLLGTSARVPRTCFGVPIPGPRKLVSSSRDSPLSLGEDLRALPSFSDLLYVGAKHTPTVEKILRLGMHGQCIITAWNYNMHDLLSRV